MNKAIVYLRHRGIGIGPECYVLTHPDKPFQFQQLLDLSVRTSARHLRVFWVCLLN
jgi:hypothetical protein